MTEEEPLYLKDIDSCYLDDFEASVLETGEDDRHYVVLDSTAFYPLGGGQPNDTGELIWSGGSVRVVDVRKKGRVMHFVEGEVPPIGTRVTGRLDWDRRYANMRMHTAQHLISSVVWRSFKARTVGNQIHPEYSHIDFHPLKLEEGDMEKIQEEANRIISQGHPVTADLRERSFFMGLEDIERLDISRVPPEIRNLRSIAIGGGDIDICPCAGTHVRNVSEIGGIRIVEARSKGKDKTRIQYVLEDPR